MATQAVLKAIARHASEAVEIVRKQRNVSYMRHKELTEAVELLVDYVLRKFNLGPADALECERWLRRQIREELTEETNEKTLC